MKLHEIAGVAVKRTRVGPGAVCIITGASYTEVSKTIRAVSGEARLPAHIGWPTLRKALTLYGFKATEEPVVPAPTQAVLKALDPDHKPEKPSLAAWLPLRSKRQRESMLVVRLSNGGIVVVLNQRGAHVWSKGSVPLSDLLWRRAKVMQVFSIADERAAKAEIENTIRRQARQAIARAKADAQDRENREKLRRVRATRMIKPRAILLAKKQNILLVEHDDRIDCAALARSFGDWSEALAYLTARGSEAAREAFAKGGYSWEKPALDCAA